MGKTIDIECSAEVEIDDYVSEISDDVLMEEVIDRLDKINDVKRKREMFNLLCDDDNFIIDFIATSRNLNIIDADRLKTFLNDLG